MNKRKMFFASVFSAVLMSSIMISNLGPNPFYGVLGSEDPITMTLDSDNAPTILDGEGTLKWGNYSTLTYTGVSALDGYHAVLETGGTISKTEASYGLRSITATFEGAIRFECGYQADYKTQEVVYMADLETGVTLSVSGNYWNIVALSETKITSISLTYNCLVEDEGSISSYVGLVGIQNIVDYARGVKIDDTIYYAVYCTYDNALGRIKAEDLTIVGDLKTQTFNCNFIETTGPDTFIAYFDVSTSHAEILGTAESVIVYAHMYINGIAFNTTDGTNGNGNVASSSNLLHTTKMSVSGNRGITFSLRNTGTKFSWMIFESKNFQDFNVATDENTAHENNLSNPYAAVNGGSTGASYSIEDGSHGSYYYGSTNGKTYTMKVVANQDVNATFSLITGGRVDKTLSFFEGETANNPHITEMTLNGETTGVTGLADVGYTFTDNGFGRWHNYKHCALATLALTKGVNEISYTLSVDDRNNLNMAGVGFELHDADARINLYHHYDMNLSPVLPTLAESGNTTIIDYSTNNGVYTRSMAYDAITDVQGTKKYKDYNLTYEKGLGFFRHGEILGYTLTAEFYVEEAVEVNLSMIASGRNRYFSPIKEKVSSNSYYAYFDSILLNGGSENFTLSSDVTHFDAWANRHVANVGTFTLQEGRNVLTFKLNGANDQSKLNLTGFAIESFVQVKLADF